MTVTSRHCVGARAHRPRALELEDHHVFPTGLAYLLGIPPPRVTVPLCGTCHNNVHYLLKGLINTGKAHARAPAATRSLVSQAWDWWRATLLDQAVSA